MIYGNASSQTYQGKSWDEVVRKKASYTNAIMIDKTQTNDNKITEINTLCSCLLKRNSITFKAIANGKIIDAPKNSEVEIPSFSRNKKINPKRIRQLNKTISIILIIGSAVFISKFYCVYISRYSSPSVSYSLFNRYFYGWKLLIGSEVKANKLEFNPEKKKSK
jgi:hypothetical protein